MFKAGSLPKGEPLKGASVTGHRQKRKTFSQTSAKRSAFPQTKLLFHFIDYSCDRESRRTSGKADKVSTSLKTRFLSSLEVGENKLERSSLLNFLDVVLYFSINFRGRIRNTSFSSSPTNRPNKLECYIKHGWKGLPVTNTLSYWSNSKVTKKKKCCEYGPRSLLAGCWTYSKIV